MPSSGSAPETLTLGGGRRLSYAEYGDPGGRPVLYFHGFPGSRLEARLMDPVARLNGVRLLAPDRPGYGSSDRVPGRRLAHWPDDVAGFADALGLGRFHVLGASGGAPYAAACARYLPDRLVRLGIVCGLGPPDAPDAFRGMIPANSLGLRAARRMPWMARPLFAALSGPFRAHPRFFVERLAARTTLPDRTMLARPEVSDVMVSTFAEAFRRGPDGPARDAVLYAAPWGFRLDEITVPALLWHGERDVVVPPATGRFVARALPECTARYFPREGHFSLPFGRAQEILRDLVG